MKFIQISRALFLAMMNNKFNPYGDQFNLYKEEKQKKIMKSKKLF